MRDVSIGILLMRCGAWTVGVDALSVRAIRPPRNDDKPIDLGKFLHIEGNALPTIDASKRRVVELGSDREVTFGIDGALGTRSLTLGDVQPLSPVLEHYGAPAWWIGTMELEGELVLLVDLSALASQAA